MRKNILALSIAAIAGSMGLVGASSAAVITASTEASTAPLPLATEFRVSPDGIGHVLLVPYYSVQNGNNTLLSIVNTDTTNGKVVKVRFRGASNSDDVFDFQIFMSPGDVWNANVHINADGKAELFTADKSCTLPASVNQGFVTDRLPSTYTAAQKNAQTLEGYIEILNTADIRKARFTLPQTGLEAGDNPLYQATKHVGGVAPCTTAILDRTGVDPVKHDPSTDTDNAAFQGLTYPTSGLLANWTIINVPGATTWSGAATSVVATTAGGAASTGNLVFHPQTNAAVADPDVRTADPLLAGGNTVVTAAGVVGAGNVVVNGAANTPASVGIVPASMFDFPDLSTPYVIRPALTAAEPIDQAAALTGSLAVTSVKNEYLTNPGITAGTDWVFSSPTRRYTVAVDYSTTPFRRAFTAYGAAADQYFFDVNTLLDTASGQVCVLNVTPTSYDQEETTPTSGVGFVISPGGQAAPLTFCGEVSVLSFNNASGTSVLGAVLARKDIDLNYTDGWVTIATPGNAGIGLPILGASFETAFNPAASAGIAGNYGLTFGHRFTRP